MKNQTRNYLIDIEDIKKDMYNKKRKWGLHLYKFILPYLEEQYKHEKIVCILNDKYDLQISIKALRNIIWFYKKSNVNIPKTFVNENIEEIVESIKKGEDKKVEIVLKEDSDPDEIMKKLLSESSESSSFEDLRAKIKKQITW